MAETVLARVTNRGLSEAGLPESGPWSPRRMRPRKSIGRGHTGIRFQSTAGIWAHGSARATSRLQAGYSADTASRGGTLRRLPAVRPPGSERKAPGRSHTRRYPDANFEPTHHRTAARQSAPWRGSESHSRSHRPTSVREAAYRAL